MNILSKDIPTLVFQLLPGFVTASIFYTLTAHPKTTEFERVIQALIFTVLLKVIVVPVRGMLHFLGRHCHAFGTWTAEAELTWMILLAIPLGLLFVWMANRDIFHGLARKCKLTGRTSYPSEWYAAFIRERRWVILNLGEGRRLYGWPEEWPDQSDKGHFLIDQPEWVMADGSRVPILQTSKYMVPAADVKQVEFLTLPAELTITAEEQRRLQEPLIALHRSQDDGSEATTTRAEPASNQSAAGNG